MVHVIGVEEGLRARSPGPAQGPPSPRRRRLFYVACTRAERRLRITWAEARRFGDEPVARRPSSFLDELRPTLERSAPGRRPGAARRRSARPRSTALADDRVDALRRWRDTRARAAGIAPSALLPDAVLTRVARRRPPPTPPRWPPCPAPDRWCWPVSPTRSSNTCEDEVEGRAGASLRATGGMRDAVPDGAELRRRCRRGGRRLRRPAALRRSSPTCPEPASPRSSATTPRATLVHLDVRWRFTASLSSAARAVIDPNRLTGCSGRSTTSAARKVTFEMVADHYADRFHCEGSYRLRADAGGHPPHQRGRPGASRPCSWPAPSRTPSSTASRSSSAAEALIVERFVNGGLDLEPGGATTTHGSFARSRFRDGSRRRRGGRPTSAGPIPMPTSSSAP